MSKTRMGKRVASLLLSLVMMLSLLPTTVYAEGADTGDTTDEIVGQATTSGDNTEGTGEPEPTGEGEDGSANVTEGEDGAATNDAVVEETIAPVNAEGVDAVANAESSGDEVSGEDGNEATSFVTVNGVGYATLEAAIASAEPVNGVITYTINGKVDVTATGWIQVAKAGLTGLTAVKFVGATDDAAIYVTKEDAVLADQVYGNVDVSFSGLTLVKENPTYLNDYAEFTQYFAMEIRATVKTGVVTYTDCKFPEGVINNTYGKTVFTGCEFSNDDSRYNLWVKEGEVELNNGAFTGTRGVKLYNTGNAKATITVKDTTFDGLTGKAAIVVSQPAPADVTLENVTARNCTVGLIQKDTATDATIIKANGESISGTFNITNAGNAKDEFNISAGTFTSEVPNDYCADGFEVKANADGTTYGVVEAATAAAQIGEKGYATLADAIAAANTGDTVTLLADATEDVTIDKNITLDLGGKTLTNTNAGKATISVSNGATATVKNGSVVGGTSYYNIQNNGTATLENVTATTGNNGSAMIDNWGTLTINSGTYTGGLDTVKNEPGAKLTITGGEFTLTKGTSKGFTGVVFNYGALEISGGTFIQSDKSAPYGQAQVIHTDKSGSSAPSTVITGGTFKNLGTKSTAWTVRETNAAADATKVSGGTFNKSVSESYCADGFIPTKNADGTYGVKEGQYVAQIGSKYYETLADAIRLATKGKIITLLADVTENVEIAANKNLTLDLNGKTLNGGTEKGKAALTNHGTITIKDSSEGKTGTIMREDTAENSGVSSHYVIDNQGTMTIESGTVRNNSGYRKTNPSGSMVGSSLIRNGDDTAATLTITGGTLEQKNFIAIKNGSLGTLNVSGGTISSDHSAIQNWFVANITGGKINGQLWTDAWEEGESVGKTTIGENAKFTGEIVMDITGSGVVPKLEITGGDLDVTNWRITKAAAKAGAKPAISGGTFKAAVPAEYCADGYIPTKNEGGTYGVKEGSYVAETNGVKYESLAEAITAARKNATVKLLADTRENVTIANDLTLDLNGHTLNGGTEKGKPALTVKASVNVMTRVTVKDSSEAQTGIIMREDTAENSGVSSHYVIDIQGKCLLTFESGNVKNNSGNKEGKGASLVRVGDDSNMEVTPFLTITGGTFTQNNFIAIKVDHGILNLSGGEVNSANSYAVENWCNANIKGGIVNGTVSTWVYSKGAATSKLTIIGGTVKGDVASVNYDSAADKQARVFIEGGTVTGTLGTYTYNNGLVATNETSKATIKVSGGTFNNAVETRYCDEGYTPVQISDGKYGVQQQQVLAKIGDTAYYTMDEAFRAVQANETIVMQRDYTTGAEQNSGSKSFTIDLNGKTWTYTGTNTNHAAFEINHSDVTLTVKNGTVVSNSMVGLIPSAMGVGSTITYDNAGLVFEGVTMTANGHSGIETNGNNTNDTVTLKNSTLNVPNGFGIYFPSSGTLTIDNSTITAKTMGVQVCAGSLSINAGSTITVTGDAVPKTENDGAIQDGAAISIVNRTGYKGLGKIEVTGGTFTAKTGNAAIKAYDWKDNTESAFTANDKINVSGGTFSSAVKEEYCATGYIPTTNSDGTHGVKEGQYVAYVGNNSTNKFETLQAAIDAAKDNQTVRLLADITLTETAVFPEGKKVSINLQGHKITATGTALRINGTTEINSSKTGAPDAAQTGMIESTNNVAVAVGNNAKLSVFSGTLKGREGAVITGTSTGATIDVRGSKATLIATDNAVIAGNGSERDGDPNNITIRNGTFIGSITTTGYIACGIYAPWNDNVTVSGGTFNIPHGAGIVARAGTVKVTGGTFTCGDGTAKGWVGDSKNNVPDAALVFDEAANYPALTMGSKILVSGGSFSTDPAANGATLADGYIATQTDGMYKVAKANPVAEINGVKYDTLSQAIAALEDKGGTIKLLQDINTPSMNYKITENITIDLNGHNITGSGAEGVFYVYTSGHLTITGDGVITAVEDNKAAIAVQVFSANAKVTLEGGTYKQKITNINDPHFDLIYVYYGTAEIKGGTYEGTTPNWTLNCKDEHYQSKEAKIEVTGGTFVGFDPRNNPAEGAGTSFVAESVGVDKNTDGTFTAKPNMAAQIVDAGGGSVAAYAGHWDAIAAAKDGETVILLSDRKNFVTNTIDANITIDLNGKTLSVGNNYPVFRTNGEVTIQNGTITSNYACVIVNAYNKLTLKNVKITGVTGDSGKNLVNVCSNAEVTIDKDTVLTASGSNGAAVFIGQDADAKYTLNVYGKVIRESKSFAISGNGSYKGTTTINIYDGAEVRSASVAIYHPQAGVINVNGGLVEGYCAIGIKSGSLNIKGGTVRGTANDHILDDSDSISGTIRYDGSAIVVDSHTGTGYKGDVNIKISGSAFIQSRCSTGIREIGNDAGKTNVKGLSISGGTVLSGGGKDAVQVREVTKNNVSITGGSFSTDVAAYCATGYQCNVPTADEPLYTVTKKDADEIDVKRSLTLDNSLTMNYKVKLPTGYTSASVEFKFYNDYTKAFETATVTGVFNKSTGRYESAFTGINPQRMTDTLKATVYATNEDTQEETAFPVDDFSAAQYCNVLLASGYNKNGAYNELVGNLVAYGTAAQLYQKYHTDKLVSSVVTGGTVVQHPLADVAEVNKLTAATGGVSIEKKSLVLSNAFAIRVKFALEGDTTIDQVTFKVKADAKTATISQFEKETLSDGTVYYYFDFAGLNSKQLGSTVTFTAVVDGKDNDVLAFSANTYLKLMSNVAGVSTELKNLLAALYNYGYTCRNFKA